MSLHPKRSHCKYSYFPTTLTILFSGFLYISCGQPQTIDSMEYASNYNTTMGKKAKFSHYIPTRGGINVMGDPTATASGERVNDWLYRRGGKGNGVACAPVLGFGTRVRLKNLGEFQCIDSGCGIVDTGSALWFDVLVKEGDQGLIPAYSSEDPDWEILHYVPHSQTYLSAWRSVCNKSPGAPPSGWQFIPSDGKGNGKGNGGDQDRECPKDPPDQVFQCDDDGCNVRDKPGATSENPPIGKATSNQSFTVLRHACQKSTGYIWYEIDYNGTPAWVWSLRYY